MDEGRSVSWLGRLVEGATGLDWPDSGSGDEWNAIGALINLTAALVALFAVLHAIRAFRQEMSASHYTEIDRLYFDLQKMNKTDAIYPFLVWNFIETIVDRCDGGRNLRLYRTWEPVIRADGIQHLAWFLNGNSARFKKSFRCWVKRNLRPDLPPPRYSRMTLRLGGLRVAILVRRPDAGSAV